MFCGVIYKHYLLFVLIYHVQFHEYSSNIFFFEMIPAFCIRVSFAAITIQICWSVMYWVFEYLIVVSFLFLQFLAILDMQAIC